MTPSPQKIERLVAWVSCTVVLVFVSACERSAAVGTPAPESPASTVSRANWPADTVLALNGAPIRAAEVDAIASIITRAEEEHTLPHLRRIALTNVVLMLHATRQFAGESKRAAALDRARAWRDALAGGEAPPSSIAAPIEDEVRGGFGMTGLEVWDWALDCTLNEWSQPIETPGAWRVARVLERSAGLRPCDVVLRVELHTFVWDTSASFDKDVEAFVDRSKLEYVDDAWRDLVPTLWQRRLRGTP